MRTKIWKRATVFLWTLLEVTSRFITVERVEVTSHFFSAQNTPSQELNMLRRSANFR